MKRICLGLLGTIFVLFFEIQAKTSVKELTFTQPLIPKKNFADSPAYTHVRISTDGKRLAYLAPDQQHVQNIFIRPITENQSIQVSFVTNNGIDDFWWSYDAQKIFYTYAPNGTENTTMYAINLHTQENTNLTPFADTLVSLVSYRRQRPQHMIIQMNKDNKELFDAYELDIKTGKLTVREKNTGDISDFMADEQLNIRAALRQRADGSTQMLVKKDNKWHPFITWNIGDHWSEPLRIYQDTVYALDSRDHDTNQLVRIDLTTGKKVILASNPTYDIAGVAFNPTTEIPVLYYSSDDRAYPTALDTSVHADIELINHTLKNPWALVSTSQDFNSWIITVATDVQPTQYFFYNRTTKQLTFLFESRPQLRQYTLQPTQRITIKSRDGLDLHSYLTLPPTQQRTKLPLVLLVHGGPWSADTWEYDADVQLLANRGYAVLRVNFRGSTGYGKKFLNAANKEWGGKMQDDLIDAVNWAISQKIADPKRVAIMGYSYGGYATLAGLTFSPDIFCCGVDLFGFSTLVIDKTNTVPYNYIWFATYKQYVGDQVADAELIKTRSPVFHVSQIKKPLFIAQGANDPRCLPIDTKKFLEELDNHQVKYEYLLFEDEGHGLVKPANQLKLYTAVEKFLAKYLGGRHET